MKTAAAIIAAVLLAAPVAGARERVNPLPAGFTGVECPAAPGASGPFLHTTSEGRVTLGWVEPAGEGHRLRFSTWRDGAWTKPRTAAQGSGWFVNWADVPSVIASGDGRMAAHWLVKSGGDTYAYDVRVSQSFDDGATWSEPVTPHDDGTATEHGFASLIFHGGYLHVVWLDGRKYGDEDAADEMTLRAARVDREGRVSGEVELDGRTCDCCPTAVAPIDGGFIVAYRDRTPEEIRDISTVRYIHGEWEAPGAVHHDNWKIDGCPVNGPALGSDGTRVALAWFTMAGGNGVVRGVWSSDGGATFSAPVTIAEESTLGRVASSGVKANGATIAWLSARKGDARIEARRMDGARVSEPARTLAYTSAGRSSGYPRLASVGAGLLVAWTESGEPSRVRTGIMARKKDER